MNDIVMNLLNSKVQHGKLNDRVYLMDMADENKKNIINELNILAEENNYSKIFAKVPDDFKQMFLDDNYIIEARIPGYYNGKYDCILMSKFYSPKRCEADYELINKVLAEAGSKEILSEVTKLKSGIVINKLNESHAEDMARLYAEVFTTYPFPINDRDYLIKSMNDNVLYYGIFDNNKLFGIASSEINHKYKNAEMTDFAILPRYRGSNYALNLLKTMEEEMNRQGIKVLYTIARAESYGINITFRKLNYIYSGTLINNTNIAGKIESMNVWYRIL